ncbi:DUF3397 domain-containing protein [Paraliobacillus salinarum]|uniref:DUF3397 domain-containing protein n=1 Tax=Paraliobacillus salinarum TaxID=1158996 RepID=UPI0015F3595F|nr:DUF3397 domain-containing protein [Paraliobacillus salinarum]
MLQIIGLLTATAVTLPWVTTIILYIINKVLYNNNKRALHFSVAYSTIFYIISVLMMLHQLFNRNFSGLIIIMLLSGLMFTIIIQWKRTDNIIFKKACRLFWRASFLFFFLCHFVLALIGLIITVINS